MPTEDTWTANGSQIGLIKLACGVFFSGNDITASIGQELEGVDHTKISTLNFQLLGSCKKADD